MFLLNKLLFSPQFKASKDSAETVTMLSMEKLKWITRCFVQFLLASVFLFMMFNGIFKWGQAKVGETHTTKETSKVFLPSVTMLPSLELNHSLEKLSHYESKFNLTEYYGKISGSIKQDIILIRQSYETEKG